MLYIYCFVELQSLAVQEWIVFQKKIYLIDEFVSKWSNKLEPYTQITLFMQQQLDKYTVGILSSLSLCKSFCLYISIKLKIKNFFPT